MVGIVFVFFEKISLTGLNICLKAIIPENLFG